MVLGQCKTDVKEREEFNIIFCYCSSVGEGLKRSRYYVV